MQGEYDLKSVITSNEWEKLPVGSKINFDGPGTDDIWYYKGMVYDQGMLVPMYGKKDGPCRKVGDGDARGNWFLTSAEDAKTVGRKPVNLTAEEKYRAIETVIGTGWGDTLTLTKIRAIINAPTRS